MRTASALAAPPAGSRAQAGRTISFYAPAALLDALDCYLKEACAGRRGAASEWFVEMAVRDLTCKGYPVAADGRDRRAELLRGFAELISTHPDRAERMLSEATGDVATAAGGAR